MFQPALTIEELELGCIVHLKDAPSQLIGTDLDLECLDPQLTVVNILGDGINICIVIPLHYREHSEALPYESDWLSYISDAPVPSHPRDNDQIHLTDRDSLPRTSRLKVHKFRITSIELLRRLGGLPTSRCKLTTESFNTLVVAIRLTQYPSTQCTSFQPRSYQYPLPLITFPSNPEPESITELLPPSPSSETPLLGTPSSRDPTPESSPPGTPTSWTSIVEAGCFPTPERTSAPFYAQGSNPQLNTASTKLEDTSGIMQAPEQRSPVSQTWLWGSVESAVWTTEQSRNLQGYQLLPQDPDDIGPHNLPQVESAEHLQSPGWPHPFDTPFRTESPEIPSRNPEADPLSYPIHRNSDPSPPEFNKEPSRPSTPPIHTQDHHQNPWDTETTGLSEWDAWPVALILHWFREKLGLDLILKLFLLGRTLRAVCAAFY